MAGRCRAFKYKLHPTTKQAHALEHLLAGQRALYNAALEERIGVWRWDQRLVTRFEQFRALAGLHQVSPDLGLVHLATLSDGTRIPNPRHGKNAALRLAAAQRDFATRRLGSLRRRKSAERIGAIHRKVARQRLDDLHEASRLLVDRFDLIAQ